MRRLLLSVILSLGLFAPALAVNEADRVGCFSLGNENYKDKDKIDPGIAACTRLINGGDYKGNALASVYRARGSWKTKKDALDAALADFGIAISLEPNNVESFDYRADVYQQKGDFDKALSDYDRASKIDPTYAAAYFSRGLIYEKKGDVTQARIEFNKALAVPTKDRIAKWAQDNAKAHLDALADAK